MDMSCQTDFNFLWGDVFAILILSRGASRTQALKAHPPPRHPNFFLLHFDINIPQFTLSHIYYSVNEQSSAT
jgi:hypothetical protein